MNDMVVGKKMYQWAADLFPICRSITGNGVRTTLAYLKKILPDLRICEVATGTKTFDWVVAPEWNIKDAFVADEKGNRIIDFRKNNLHVVGYSVPVDKIIDLEHLQEHLYSLPAQPDAIPYVTSYYQRRWGFCLPHSQRVRLKAGALYRVKIDSTLKPGHLTYGELIIQGKTRKEIFLSTYICHPSMANNELSGIVVTTALAQWLYKLKSRKYTYRVVFIPETIGSIVYLSRHIKEMKKNIVAGFVVNCVGDERQYSFLPSRGGNTLADRVALHVLGHHAKDYILWSFLDRGSDERQYCSPGVDLPIASIMRSKYGSYPEYHTSLDNLSFISAQGLEGSYNIFCKCLELLEQNEIYTATLLCEPHLSKRSLYPTIGTKEQASHTRNIMNFLAYADGHNDVISIAKDIGVYAGNLSAIIEKLLDLKLIKPTKQH